MSMEPESNFEERRYEQLQVGDRFWMFGQVVKVLEVLPRRPMSCNFRVQLPGGATVEYSAMAWSHTRAEKRGQS